MSEVKPICENDKKRLTPNLEFRNKYKYEIPEERLNQSLKRKASKTYKMDQKATMEQVKKQSPKECKRNFDYALASGNNPKVRLIPKGEEF